MYIIKLSIKLSLIATAIMSCCYFGTGLFINQDCYSLLIVSDAYKNAVSQIKWSLRKHSLLLENVLLNVTMIG